MYGLLQVDVFLDMNFSVLLPNSTEAFEDGYRYESPAGHSNASFTTGT